MSENMLEQDVIEMLMDHYDNPRNYGKLDNPDIKQNGGNSGCGDSITIYMEINGDGVVRGASFEGEGCIISQATSSLLTEYIKGKSIEEIEELDSEFLRKLVGKDILSKIIEKSSP